MTVLSSDQIMVMQLVMDDILRHQSITVEDIKKKYHLTGPEYEMIFDLCMPNIRLNAIESYTKSADAALKKEIRKIIRMKEITDSEKLYMIKNMCAYPYSTKKKTEENTTETTEEEAS